MFQRLNKEEDYGGYGIGLANCKKIADIHGGRIWAESEFGVGTTIKFTIPKLDDGKAIELYNAD
jgi:signal transduction histidine kinase